jgi:hypothetical protein
LQTKKIKNEIKDFCRRRYLDLKKEIYNGGFAKDMIQGRTCSHCGIMFEKSTVIQCYVTPAILKRTMKKIYESHGERTIKQVP